MNSFFLQQRYIDTCRCQVDPVQQNFSLGEAAKRFTRNILGDTQNDVMGKKQGYDADWIGRGMRPFYTTFFPACIVKVHYCILSVALRPQQLTETFGALADSGAVVPFYQVHFISFHFILRQN